MAKTVDRPLKDIVRSVQELIKNPKMGEQLKRDLEKLCAAASVHPAYEIGE